MDISEFEAERYFLCLAASVLNGQKSPDMPRDVTVERLEEIASRQNMIPMLYAALSSLMKQPEGEAWQKLRKRFLSDCMRSEIQTSECQKLITYLCANGVKLLPLKGCVLKDLYPYAYLRVMNDVDMLYEGVSAQELSELMEKAGYMPEQTSSDNHDVFHKRPVMSVELHRTLLPEYSPYKSVLQDPFSKAVPDARTKNLFHMRPEELYIHIIIHAANHAEESGMGIRTLGDVYLLNCKYASSWDHEYIKSKLDNAGLAQFEQKLSSIAQSVFGENADLPPEYYLFFFRGRTYGAEHTTWEYMTDGGASRSGFILYRLFLPYKHMRKKYPVLNKAPVLLPVMWVHRVIDGMINRRGKMRAVFDHAKKIDNDSTVSTVKVMRDLGFYSKQKERRQ